MTVAGLAALAGALGAIALYTRRWRGWPWLVGLAGFAVLLVGAWSLPLGVRTQIGGETLQSTGYLRLLLMLLAVAGGALTVVAAAVSATRSLPALIFVWFGVTAVALAAADALPAILLLTTGSLAAILIAVEAGGSERAMVAARGLRAIVVAGFLAAIAISWTDVAAAGLRAGIVDTRTLWDGGAIGLAYLAGAAAFALRAGAIPLHAWSSRLTDGLPPLAVPVTFAWGPAALAIVILGWSQPDVQSLGQPLAVERTVVGLIAVVSIMFGALAAVLHDDLEHVVAYSMVSDAGIVLLAVAAEDPAAWGPVRTWILAYLVAKTALAAWAVTTRATFATSRIPDLRGWARRSPLLAGGLIVTAAVSVGLPGLAAWQARGRLIDLALQPPFDIAAWAGVLASAGYFVRLLISGFRRPSTAVAMAVNLAPAWPGGRPRRIELALVRQLPAAWRLNRAPIAAGAVLALAALGLAVAAGAFHGPGISAAPPPGVAGMDESEPSPSAGPSAAPSVAPSTSITPGESPTGAPAGATGAPAGSTGEPAPTGTPVNPAVPSPAGTATPSPPAGSPAAASPPAP